VTCNSSQGSKLHHHSSLAVRGEGPGAESQPPAPGSQASSTPANTPPNSQVDATASNRSPEASNQVTTSTQSAGGSCGGQPKLESDGVNWTCTFDSEFTGTSYDPAQWQAITTAKSGFTSGSTACFVDSPNNISVGNGYLSLTARKEDSAFKCQDPEGSFVTQETSGYLSTYQRFSQAYGRFEVSAKVPTARTAGLQSSLWLYPESLNRLLPHGYHGEIDFAEIFSDLPSVAIPYIHYMHGPTTAATDTNVVTNDNCPIIPGQFNDYVLEWTPGTLHVIINGQTCLIDHWEAMPPQSGNEPFDVPFFMNLTQALGVRGNNYDPATTPLPATTEVQYVRVWQDESLAT